MNSYEQDLAHYFLKCCLPISKYMGLDYSIIRNLQIAHCKLFSKFIL